jgi:cytosine/adenosine deaminase-related metal-dependent hydrolase
VDQSQNLLIRDALVVTLDSANTVLEAADVRIADGTIVAVEAPQGARPGYAGRVIEAKGRLLVPGFVNAHTHSPSNLVHGTGDRQSHPAYMWLNQVHTANKTPREIYVSAMMGAIQMLLSGTTAVLDHFPGQACTDEEVDAVMAAHRDSGMRVVLGLRFYDAVFGDIMPRGIAIPDDVAAEMRRLDPLKPMPLAEVRALIEGAVARWHGAAGGRLAVFPSPSNPERCSEAALVMCGELAERYDLGIHTHLLESRVQSAMAREKYGCSMVAQLGRLGLLGPRLSCAHTIWVDDDDIALLADSGTVVVHNPESNMKIGTGTAPIPTMAARGVPVAIGTDGVGTNDNLIMHEAVRLAAMLHRPSLRDRAQWLSAFDVMRMATEGGACALRQRGRIGSIEVGKRADLVLYRLDAPWWIPVNDPVNQIVFAENGSSVDTVVVDGRVVVENRRIVAFDAEAILAEARPMMAAIVKRNARLHALAARMGELIP